MNQFGDERKQTLANSLPPEHAAQMKRILDDVQPVVLGVTCWECFEPWRVPERRICDNFILAVTAGAERITVRDEERILTRGEWIAVPEFVPHSFGLAPGCRHAAHFICHALFACAAGANPFDGFRTPFLRFDNADAEFGALSTIVALRNTAPESAMRFAGWKLLEWMVAEAGRGNFQLKTVANWDERIRSALHFIELNFRGNIGVPDIAAAARLGEARLRTRFRNATGMTPGAYLTRMRLLYAARQLARYDEAVTEIARQAGFSSAAYFCSAFKAVFQQTPGEFRNSIRRT